MISKSNSQPKQTQLEINNRRALDMLLRIQEANAVIGTSKYTPRRD